jgi:hypothetical protein
VPRSKAGRYFDLILLVLSGLSGPFCIFLLPFAASMALKRRDPWRRTPAIVLAACCLVQALSLLVLDAHTRPHDTLGATPAMFARLLGGNVILGVVLGHNNLAAAPGSRISMLLACAAIVGAVLAAACFFKSTWEMRLFLILAGMLFTGSLLSSSTYPPAGSTVWHVLALAAGGRYWFFPSLAFAWSLLYCLRNLSSAGKIVPVFLLVATLFSIVLDWREPALKASHYAEELGSFEAAPPGTAMVFPLNPEGWTMRLVKHASR